MRFLLFFIATIISSATLAGGPARGGPPPEAFSVCQDTGEGGSCSFTAPHGQINGQCRTMREGKVCVPSGMSGRPQPGQRPDMSIIKQNPGRPGFAGVEITGDNPDALVVRSRVPDTHQGGCFDNQRAILCPEPGTAFYGQDAQYLGAEPSYRDNGDGTVTDLITDLVWQQAHHDTRLDFYSAKAVCEQLDLGGRQDWRLPSIKELFSIIDFRGAVGGRPYLNDIFEIRPPVSLDANDQFASTHSPEMMGQTWSSTIYAGQHYGRPGVEAAFFVNFLDGRIKQAPTNGHMGMFYRCVSGAAWGANQFVAHDEVVEDKATGLIWQKSDDGKTRDWPQALAYCENLQLDGHNDWRLPNAKELQTIVDYSRPEPALDQRYMQISDPKAWFWSSTTHGDNIRQAAYVCFGACTSVDDVDVHGAGAQRSDPKAGNPDNFGPMGGQRDEVRINNLVRCVR